MKNIAWSKVLAGGALICAGAALTILAFEFSMGGRGSFGLAAVLAIIMLGAGRRLAKAHHVGAGCPIAVQVVRG
jgi:hypothetical protein